MSGNATIPSPLIFSPSEYWDGNDGSWNTFVVQIGNPPQKFRVLPSTACQELWVPVPDGCTAISPANPGYCGYLRGSLPVNGVNSSGFYTNKSSTWSPIGLYTLDEQEAKLGYGGDGLYGFDTVIWGDDDKSPDLTRQVVAGIADPDFWVGIVGIGPKPSNFSTLDYPITSYLSNLVNDSLIPSLSWGYTAGAAYKNRTSASLTLGGYDADRYQARGLSVNMSADTSRPLQLAVQKILGTNTLNNAINLLPTATYHFIDSTLPHIWLPDDSIDQFVSSFGLTYDNATDLFLINDTMREKMLDLNPTVTFVFSADLDEQNTANTVNIVLPYAAFDLQASYPFYQNATNYFPIRRAANSSQYSIGRTLLQEAYLIADFDRNNFTVAQTKSPDRSQTRVVAIEQPAVSGKPSAILMEDSRSHGLSGGTVAGIAVGIAAGMAVVLFLIWFFRRREKRRSSPPFEHCTDTFEIKSSQLAIGPYEFAADNERVELQGRGRLVSEVPAFSKANEVEGETAKWSNFGVQEVYTPGVEFQSGYLSEVHGSEVLRHELDGVPIGNQR